MSTSLADHLSRPTQRGQTADIMPAAKISYFIRVNGYAGGYGTLQNFQKEANSLGLSSAGSKRLLEMVQALDKSTRYAAKSGAFCPVPFKVVN